MFEDYWNKTISFFRAPKLQMALFLGLIGLSAILFGGQKRAPWTMILAIMTTVLTDYLVVKLRKVPSFLLSAAIVTGLIIGLLAYPAAPWFYVVTVGILAILSKNFLRFNNRHIFNPAAFGLVVGGIIWGQNVSWWGVIFQSMHLSVITVVLYLLLLLPGYTSFFRMLRMRTILSFFIVVLLSRIALSLNSLNLINILETTIFSPLLIFFALVMLPEPMTSPNNRRMQILYGGFVGILATILNFLPVVTLPDSILVSLLTGNFIFYWLRLKYP